LDFTFVCPTEICQFSDLADEFRKENCEVIAASCDSKFSHLAWTKKSRKEGGLGAMNIPMIADFNKEIASTYDILVNDGDHAVPLRAMFIIDDKGILRQITINDLPVGRNVEDTLRLVKAFRFTDVHGEVRHLNEICMHQSLKLPCCFCRFAPLDGSQGARPWLLTPRRAWSTLALSTNERGFLLLLCLGSRYKESLNQILSDINSLKDNQKQA
jgi:peroxiredoxin